MDKPSPLKASAAQFDMFKRDFNALYKAYMPKIMQHIKKLDRSAGYKRTADNLEELAQGFFTWVLDKKWMNKFDPKRSNSKDPILTYLFNHLRNFYKAERTKDIKEKEVKKTMMEEKKIEGKKGYCHDMSFCYDIKNKLHKALFKSFNLLEKKAWSMFVYNKYPVKKAATLLGVSVGTAFLLKTSIYDKAQSLLEGYYSGSFNFN